MRDEEQPLIDTASDDSNDSFHGLKKKTHSHSRSRSAASGRGRSVDYSTIHQRVDPSDTITTQAILSLGHTHHHHVETRAHKLELNKLTSCPAVVEDTDVREVNHNKRKLIIAISLCFAFFIVELVAGIVAGSLAILSDSFHLLSDIAGFAISLIALYLSQQPATSTHSFGFYRAEILGAIMSTLLIWVLTAGLVWEAINRLQNPQPINGEIMFYTAAVGVCVNIVLGFTLHGEHDHSHGGHSHGHSHGQHSHSHGHTHSHDHDLEHNHHSHEDEHHHEHENEHHHEHDDDDEHTHVHEPVKRKKEMNVNIRSAALHVIGDLISSIGVLISAAIIWVNPEMTYIDPICTFLFSILVMLTTFKLMSNSLTVLMEGTPSDIDPVEVANDLRKIPGVVDVHDLHIWNLTIGKSAMAVHLDILPTSKDKVIYVTAEDFSKILNLAQDLVCAKYGIHHSTIQLEMITALGDSHSHHSPGDSIIDVEEGNCEGGECVARKATHCLPPMCRRI